MKEQFRDFKEAREFARSLGLKNYQEWREYAQTNNKPKDIPSAPNTVYKNKGWISSGDWLANGVVAYKYKTWKTFEEAKHFAISLKLQSFEEWKKYCKSGSHPEDISRAPWKVYKELKNKKRIIKRNNSTIISKTKTNEEIYSFSL